VTTAFCFPPGVGLLAFCPGNGTTAPVPAAPMNRKPPGRNRELLNSATGSR